MLKKTIFFFSVLFLIGPISLSTASDFVISDYTFTWHVAKAGYVTMEVQKQKDSLLIILSSRGGKLATLALSPAQAEAVADVLSKTDDYYKKHKESRDMKSMDTVPVGEYKVSFSSEQGENFEVRVEEAKLFTACVLLNRNDALTIAEYLKKSKEMAEFVDNRIRP